GRWAGRARTLRGAVQARGGLPTGGIAAATLLIGIYLTFRTDQFLTIDNLLDVARQSSLLGLLTIGLTFVLISGQIDLSVGSVFGLSGVIAAMAIIATHNVVLGVLAGLGVGVGAGLLNGVLASYGRLPGFIV